MAAGFQRTPASSRYALCLLGLFAVVWTSLAVSPWYRQDWALENVLVVVAVPVLAWGWRAMPLTRLSYACLFVFGVVHEIGAHYTHEADIMKIVAPTIVRPWRERIETTASVTEAVALSPAAVPTLPVPSSATGTSLAGAVPAAVRTSANARSCLPSASATTGNTPSSRVTCRS